MVGRKKYNKPIGRARGKNICWLTSCGSEWVCGSCRLTMPLGDASWQFGIPQTSTVPLPMSDHIAISKGKKVRDGTQYFRKVFLCTNCAGRFAKELSELVALVDKTSIKTLQTMEAI